MVMSAPPGAADAAPQASMITAKEMELGVLFMAFMVVNEV